MRAAGAPRDPDPAAQRRRARKPGHRRGRAAGRQRRSAPATTSRKGGICATPSTAGCTTVGALKTKHQGRHHLRRLRAAGHADPERRAEEAAAWPSTTTLCEHFPYTRQELFHLVRVGELKTFDDAAGAARPAASAATSASRRSASHPRLVLERVRAEAEARGAAGHQRLLPRQHAEGRHLLGRAARAGRRDHAREADRASAQVAKKYGLYTKITGGQRIDLFGARVEQLPLIWDELIDAGFESGHAYGKALRTVKSLRRLDLVPLRRAGLRRPRDRPREPLQGPARAAQDQVRRCRAARANAPRRRARTSASSPPKRAGTSTSAATAA